MLKGIRPIAVLPIGFLLIILIGTCLLMLPISAQGQPLSFVDALFTATSASCVTGLAVADTGTAFSLFGQIVLLLLIQTGGLGFMTLSTLLFVLTRRRISLYSRMTLAESLGEDRLQGVVRLSRSAVSVTLLIELAGAFLLAFRFVPQFGWGKGLWFSLFHSVSAFCNAGFDLMGNYTSMTAYVSDPLVCLTLMALVTLGGLGFSVLLNICSKKWTVYVRLVLLSSTALIIGGGLFLTLLEWENPQTLGRLAPEARILAGFFQSVTLRTAGFNTVDQTALRDVSKLLGILLMLFGGAPASTAGGFKTTTILLLLFTVRSHLRGREDTEAFSRRFSSDAVRRALCIVVIGLFVLLGAQTCISLLEENSGFSFLDQFYEVTSALCTVGLSVGLSSAASTASRIFLCVLMFTGRVGMLTLALSLTGGKSSAPIRYPATEIMVG